MSKTIDQRVVEMRFDNANFEKNVSTSMSTLDKLKKSEIEPNMALIRETLTLPDEVPLIPFSAEKGQGRELLLAEIMKVL